MPDQAAYPTDADLLELIQSTGVIDTSGTNFGRMRLQDKIDSAIGDWEQRTGWEPFLADGVDVTRLYDPPGPNVTRQGGILNLRGGGKKLFLDAGLVALTSLNVAGIAYELGTMFWLRPDNAPARRKPFTWIEFLVPVFGSPQSVSITGRWGFWTAIRQQVFEAVLQHAAELCVPQIALNVSNGLYKVDDVQYAGSGGMTPLSTERQEWHDYFEETVAEFERLG